MAALILLVVSVGLADSINPSTLAPGLLLATGPSGVRRLGAFTLGVFCVSLAGGVALLLGPGQLLLDALPHPSARTKNVAELVGGVLLVAFAATIWLHRHRLAERLAAREPGAAGRGAFALGAGIMAVELPTALPYFAAIAAILESPAALSVQLVLVVLYNVMFVAPLLALLAARELAGERASAKIESMGTWLRDRSPVLLAALLALIGVIVAIVGLAGLT